eukprot:CAMPEP_0113393464 /NCGR_PEP_ID=MMETSP0013_2-20120614/11892_1 /TAXON_ID=2843 ORGANISM="Skeletonema costatum, Strain 1716" /NCGR_SAMPLE_ID=MMETSP0013_2 /ASSEMBLY_ACC=CAM_ASM_000158 /LENGTH=50 /DNA_ID=CAMNT_0000277045 /DNA_START=104 /DNA_END=253 /DNA_ORIENTATION=+ /assembly_acc=CAM_ASM_000158
MSDVENGTKGNTGDFNFPKSSSSNGDTSNRTPRNKKKRVRPLNPSNDGGA